MGYVDPITKAWVYEESDNPVTDPEYGGTFSGMLARGAAQVPAQVTAALASDDTVRQGVEDAVDADIAGRDIIEAQPVVEPELIFAIVDEDQRRTVIEVGVDGKFTPHALALLAPDLAEPVGAAIGIGDQLEDVSGRVFAVVDEDGRLTDLDIGPDGRFTPRVIASLRERLAITPTASGLTLVGHSMLSGAAAEIGAAIPGRTVTSIAVGGESMNTIGARWGSHPTRVLPVGGSIPANGPVVITLNAETGNPLAQGPTTFGVALVLPDGTVIPGTFGKSGSDFTFTRTTPGAAIAVARPVTMRYDLAAAHRDNILVFWAGRNGDWTAATAVQDRLDRMEAMIRHATTDRFLVLSEHYATTNLAGASTGITDSAAVVTAITEYNRRAYLKWGERFIDTQRYIIDYGLADRGIAPTALDNTNVAAGRVPASLRVDELHLNTDGDHVVASLVKRRIAENGWN